MKLIRETERASPSKGKGKETQKKVKDKVKEAVDESEEGASSSKYNESRVSLRREPVNPGHKDNHFREFRRLCAKISETSGYLDKSSHVEEWLRAGKSGKFEGDLHVWVRLLLPGVIKRVYNMQNKSFVKIFSQIFETSEEDMIEDLEQGDVAETIGKFYEESSAVTAPKKSDLTVHDIDGYLDDLTKLTKEDDQQELLKRITARCTVNDLKMFIRLLKGDLRIQAGAKHILDGVHKEAYETFNTTRNIVAVLDKVLEVRASGTTGGVLELGASLMQPVQPMLAQPCKSIDMAFQKCPNGVYSEIKYDGERVQLHKQGKQFKFYSPSLKPVLPLKAQLFQSHIPTAFPGGSDMILDAEVLMVDNNTGKPLPFGTLGKHKGSGFKDATPCLFVFDIMFYNGENLMNQPMKKRRELLERQMVEVGNNVKFSELTKISSKAELGRMIKSVLDQGLEGLVLKDASSLYEPGKRHWLKVKKDYLAEGAMADTADLVVLGGWFGTGNKVENSFLNCVAQPRVSQGGLVSVFLMGCLNEATNKWCTVTKVCCTTISNGLTALYYRWGTALTMTRWSGCRGSCCPAGRRSDKIATR